MHVLKVPIISNSLKEFLSFTALKCKDPLLYNSLMLALLQRNLHPLKISKRRKIHLKNGCPLLLVIHRKPMMCIQGTLHLPALPWVAPHYNVMLLVAGSGYGMAVHCEQIWKWNVKTPIWMALMHSQWILHRYVVFPFCRVECSGTHASCNGTLRGSARRRICSRAYIGLLCA